VKFIVTLITILAVSTGVLATDVADPVVNITSTDNDAACAEDSESCKLEKRIDNFALDTGAMPNSYPAQTVQKWYCNSKDIKYNECDPLAGPLTHFRCTNSCHCDTEAKRYSCDSYGSCDGAFVSPDCCSLTHNANLRQMKKMCKCWGFKDVDKGDLFCGNSVTETQSGTMYMNTRPAAKNTGI
jgi:hypothetical protein